jgi:hypothetical protein
MKLEIYPLNGIDCVLSPNESVFAASLEVQLATGDRDRAITAWREWVAAGHGNVGRTRRVEVGRALGLTADHAIAAFQQRDDALANLRRLGECAAHRFDTAHILDWADAPERFTCLNCKGTMTPVAAHAYACGFAAAGGDPETVIQGFGR